MTSFLVSKEHIDAILSAYKVLDEYQPIGAARLTEIGQELWRENARSVNFKYGYRKPLPKYTFTYRETPAVAALKLAHSLNYQSCERPDWTQSRAYTLLNEIAYDLTHHVPGYAEAPWAI